LLIKKDEIIGITFTENGERKFKAHLTEELPTKDNLSIQGRKVIYNKIFTLNPVRYRPALVFLIAICFQSFQNLPFFFIILIIKFFTISTKAFKSNSFNILLSLKMVSENLKHI
jgi:hypothetical protein